MSMFLTLALCNDVCNYQDTDVLVTVEDSSLGEGSVYFS